MIRAECNRCTRIICPHITDHQLIHLVITQIVQIHMSHILKVMTASQAVRNEGDQIIIMDNIKKLGYIEFLFLIFNFVLQINNNHK